MAFEDKTLVCVQCGVEFLFSAGEQEFFHKKGFDHAPKRCRRCRGSVQKEGASRRRGPGPGAHLEYIGPRGHAGAKPQARAGTMEFVEATCSACGAVTKLPFRPDGVRPVYCKTCYQERRRHSAGRS